MSSHHVVREKQEPALLVLGLDHLDDELLGQLLEWSPTVIATTHTAEKLITRGIKVDWIISNGNEETLQSDIKLMSVGSNHYTDAALEYLVSFEYPAVNIIANELNIEDYIPFSDKLNIVIIANNKRTYPIASGFSKWKPAGDVIEIVSDEIEVAATGLQHICDRSYKTTHDGFFTLRFNAPFLFISEDV